MTDISEKSGDEMPLGRKKKKVAVPVFLENPDGSFLEGVPPGYKEKTPPMSPRRAGMHLGMQLDDDWDLMNAAMAEEFEFIASRHQRLFCCLLAMQLLVEVAYNAVFALNAGPAIEEVFLLYQNTVDKRSLTITFWTMFALNLSYGVVYYILGALAVWTNRPRYYKAFVTWCLVGVATQMLLAYINKFNLLVFFLRLLAYIYAKFLRNLAQSMALLPGTMAIRGGANGGGAASGLGGYYDSPPDTPPNEPA